MAVVILAIGMAVRQGCVSHSPAFNMSQASLGGDSDIYVMNACGSDPVNITNAQHQYASGFPDWH